MSSFYLKAWSLAFTSVALGVGYLKAKCIFLNHPPSFMPLLFFSKPYSFDLKVETQKYPCTMQLMQSFIANLVCHLWWVQLVGTGSYSTSQCKIQQIMHWYLHRWVKRYIKKEFPFSVEFNAVSLSLLYFKLQNDEKKYSLYNFL